MQLSQFPLVDEDVQEVAPPVIVEGGNPMADAEVIDLDDYVFRYCTCSVESLTDPIPPARVDLASSGIVLAAPRVVLALPAVASRERRVEDVAESSAPHDAVENAWRAARRHYTTRRYNRHREAQLASRARAWVNPRRSSHLRAS